MDKEELGQEMLNFLNETGKYQQFLEWLEERGFDKEEADSDMGQFEA